MKMRVIIILLVLNFLSVNSMTKDTEKENLKYIDQQITLWQDLPIELKQYILSLVPIGKSMGEILENLNNITKVNKEFRVLAKDLVYNCQAVGNLTKRYIEYYPENAYEEFLNAAKKGNKDTVKVLISAGIDINHNDHRGFPLLLAVSAEQKEIVQILLDAGCDPNTQDDSGYTALMLVRNSKEIAQILLNAGANVNIRNWNGDTALLLASSKDIVALLMPYAQIN